MVVPEHLPYFMSAMEDISKKDVTISHLFLLLHFANLTTTSIFNKK